MKSFGKLQLAIFQLISLGDETRRVFQVSVRSSPKEVENDRDGSGAGKNLQNNCSL